MSGQRISFKEQQKLIDEYTSRNDIYATHKPFNFDLRGFAEYVKTHNIPHMDIPSEIVAMFQK